MKLPKYVKQGGYIGRFLRIDSGEFPIYRFPGGECVVFEDYAKEHGSDDRKDLE